MNNKYSSIASSFFLIFLLIHPSSASALDLVTGSAGGSYFSVGNALSRVLAGEGFGGVLVKQSQGSIENIRSLINREADLAIVQSDLLFKISGAEEGSDLYPLRASIEELRGILALYPEYVQIIVRKNSNINRISRLQGTRIHIGKPQSGSYQNAIDILSHFSIDEGDFTLSLLDSDLDTAMSALKNQEIDAVFTTAGKIIFDSPDYSPEEFRMLSFDLGTAIQFADSKPYYAIQEFDNLYGSSVNLVFTRAVLVARGSENGIREGLRHEDARAITKIIYENQLEVDSLIAEDLGLFRDELMIRRIPLTIHSGSQEYFAEQGILVRTTVLDIAIFVFGVLWFIVLLSNWGLNWSWVRWLRNRSIVQYMYNVAPIHSSWNFIVKVTASSVVAATLLVLVFALMIVIRVILFFEQSYAIEFDTLNPFSGLDFVDTLYWLITFAFTGYPQDIFPNSYPAKLAAAFIPLLGVGSVAFLIVFNSIKQNIRADKEARGLFVPKLKDHVVVCGWNKRAPELIEEITSDYFHAKAKKVVVIAEIEGEKPLERFNFRNNSVYYLRGISSSSENLRNAHIETADCAVVVAGDKKIAEGNVRSIFTTAAIRNETISTKKNELKIIAELHYLENEANFIQNGVSKLVCLQRYSSRLLAHSFVNPGTSETVAELLSFDPPNNVSLHLPASDELKSLRDKVVGRTFCQSIVALRKEGILLLSVYRPDLSGSHTPMELEFRLKSPYLLVPNDDEDAYTIKENDFLMLVQTRKFGKGNQVENISDMPAFNYGEENVLIVAGRTYAKNIVSSIDEYCKSIVVLTLGEEPKREVSECSRITYIDVVEFDEQLVVENFDLFSSIDRVLISNQRFGEQLIPQDIYEDDKTMMLASTLQGIYRKLFDRKSIPIAAELKSQKNWPLFKSIGISQPIATNQFIENSVAQMVYHDGKVAEFFVKSMNNPVGSTAPRLQRISVDSLPEEISNLLIGQNYDFALESLLPYELQLIAIIKGHGQVVLNPAPPENEICIEQKDCLFVFARAGYDRL